MISIAQESTIKYGKNRVVTLYWYLNDVEEGGGGYTFSPQSGNLPRPRSFKLSTIDDCHTGSGLVVKPKKGNANRRLFFSTRNFLNVTKNLRNIIIGAFDFPPILVLPLVAFAYFLLFREEIGNIIDDKLCK